MVRSDAQRIYLFIKSSSYLRPYLFSLNSYSVDFFKAKSSFLYSENFRSKEDISSLSAEDSFDINSYDLT